MTNGISVRGVNVAHFVAESAQSQYGGTSRVAEEPGQKHCWRVTNAAVPGEAEWEVLRGAARKRFHSEADRIKARRDLAYVPRLQWVEDKATGRWVQRAVQGATGGRRGGSVGR